MDGKLKYSSEKNKTMKKKKLEINFSKKDFLLVLIFPSLVVLLTSENFLEFVVEIVKLLLNRSFYYLVLCQIVLVDNNLIQRIDNMRDDINHPFIMPEIKKILAMK